MRSSFGHTTQTKECYNQCQNINCSTTFVSYETFVRFVTTPTLIGMVPPHPINLLMISEPYVFLIRSVE
ncbi:levansucrase regulator [Photorhabdus khanii]|uniref:Levansucrase regulator n=1 Tax=Photorhabdus khanii TaxID=1004150 RepID=A0A7C9KQB7_9GAMM|nr:ogr/Delta-like zinc finger family protein [Photorhabdus khanii]MQL47506.1 levansucrase regulator [Photorhabdus khanii]